MNEKVHINNRQKILAFLEEELLGPASIGNELDILNPPVTFSDWPEVNSPFISKDTQQEILIGDPPLKRYGVGILHPALEKIDEEDLSHAGEDGIGSYSESGNIESGREKESELRAKEISETRKKLPVRKTEANPHDLDLSLTASFEQSSMGITFLAKLQKNSIIQIKFSGGVYRDFDAIVKGKNYKWWVRREINQVFEFSAKELSNSRIIFASKRKQISEKNDSGEVDLILSAEILSREHPGNPHSKMITVCLVNRSKRNGSKDKFCTFQSEFSVEVINPDGNWNILPYPERLGTTDEEKSMSLLYRDFPTFCIGHGCSGNWGEKSKNSFANIVRGEMLPSHELPSMTPDLTDETGNTIKIWMAPLAGLTPDDDGFSSLNDLVSRYEEWIDAKKDELLSLPEKYHQIGIKNLESAKNCAIRMKNGIKFLESDSKVKKAFQLANYSMLLQQTRSRDKRKAHYNKKGMGITFEGFIEKDILSRRENFGSWRAFQIAFILMTLESTTNGNIPERDEVELIWFPTGGGKTEAYLGLIAFSMFYRRILNKNDIGVNVLMRYTLRLLTTQQFQRASKLILAMEIIRRENNELLGENSFSIGLWVGSSNTPNRKVDAIALFRAYKSPSKKNTYKFVIDQCPWCGAEIGIQKKGPIKVLGLEQVGDSISFKCPDRSCDFSSSLPIYVIDEDIYEKKPSMIVGTVDKFALLAWKPEAKALFGLGRNGNRISSPPSLIVQDELHLISGPLGSMVGLYESVIEDLCTDKRSSPPISPKIVSSTATISKYEEQIKSLYGRDGVTLFPPPGINAGDSFFSKYSYEKDGSFSPGRLYVGINAPGLGSMVTTEVRTFTSLSMAPMGLPEEERDPWWTLVVFFNSLRELGTSLSLLQSDIPDYQRVIVSRKTRKYFRGLWNIKELTGRAENSEIPQALAELEVNYKNEKSGAIDVCLASNILEVGVDIDRLSLMTIVGQPKTTSQYIQVTGRVGRSWWVRPGLITTIYSPTKPRDRSHFERFRSYHERLYAKVEPSSVTPFSAPALDRALHAALVSYVRQYGDEEIANSPYPYPEGLIEDFRQLILERIQSIDPAEVQTFQKVFKRIKENWKSWERLKWEGNWQDENIPLLRRSGSYTAPENKIGTWETPTSMRNVDSECIVELADAAKIRTNHG
jgi:hypothetical protein